jgi:hypothetical protein
MDKPRLFLICGASLALVGCAARPATLAFDRLQSERVAAKGERLHALDASGRVVATAPPDDILQSAGNPEGFIYAWRPDRDRVRVSPPGREEVWVDCRELRPTGLACSGRMRPQGTVLLFTPVQTEAGSERRLFDCPGDPRCPR